jgi:hypothetical protein
MRPRPRTLAVVALAVMSLALAACGHKQSELTHSETEGNYLDLGKLTYQLQISRQLNPADLEDRGYLVAVPAAQRTLQTNETWFAIFLRVQNETNEPRPAAREFEIVDTQGKVFRPIELGADNVFAYRPTTLAPKSIAPPPDSPPAENTIQGSLLLFKIPFANLENRPLEFEIHDPLSPRSRASVALDV